MTDPKPGSFAAQLIECAERIEAFDGLIGERDKLIRRRRKQGASLRQIAEEAGISHTAVAKILAR